MGPSCLLVCRLPRSWTWKTQLFCFTLELFTFHAKSSPSSYTLSLDLKSIKRDLTTIKYVEPANPMSGETEPRAVVTTVKEYDLQQVNSQVKGIFTGLAMMGFMHLYMKYTNPLIMQSVSGVKSALESNIVKIHLYGSPATGDLKRPFKTAPGFMEMLTGGAGVQTDKASVESAEVSGAGGIKQD